MAESESKANLRKGSEGLQMQGRRTHGLDFPSSRDGTRSSWKVQMSGRKHHRLRLYLDRASGMHRASWNSQTPTHSFFWFHDMLQGYITLFSLHEVASSPRFCWYPEQQVGCLSAPHGMPRTCPAQVRELGLPYHGPHLWQGDLSTSCSQ